MTATLRYHALVGAPGLRLAVIGGSECTPAQRRLAVEVGREIARRGAVLICGGRGGVMAAAAEGARAEGGRTVGILPGASALESPPNEHVELPLFTGLGQARNQVVVLSGVAVIGIGGGWGTLSEIAIALKHRVPVVLLDSWRLDKPDGERDPLLRRVESAAEAVELAIGLGSER